MSDPITEAINRLHAAEAARIAARETFDEATLEVERAARAVAGAEEAARLRKLERHAAAYRELEKLGRTFAAFYGPGASHGGEITGVGANRMILDALARVRAAGGRDGVPDPELLKVLEPTK